MVGDPLLPEKLRKEYYVGDTFEKCKDLLLSPRGVSRGGNGIKLSICSTCFSSLWEQRFSGPPKFSIANGFAIGQLPEKLRGATVTELALVKKLHVTVTY